MNKDDQHFLSVDEKAPPRSLELESGVCLMNRFHLQRLLGRGRHGSVYLATDQLQSRDIALKVMEIEDQGGKNIQQTFIPRELQAYQQILHYQHILRIYDIHLTSHDEVNLALLSIEYANEGSFRDWLLQHYNEDISQHYPQGIEYFKQACKGIQVIHDAGLAHLDLKPENLLIQDKVIKVTDFGFSRLINPVKNMDQQTFHDGLGTPVYMAPEQILAARPKDVNHLADVYALGCILFEILDGDPPFMGTSEEILAKHRQGILPNVNKFEERFAMILLKCLSPNPRDRYHSVTELLSAVDEGAPTAHVEPQWYLDFPERFQEVQDKLASIGTVVEVFNGNGIDDLTIDVACLEQGQRFPFRFIFPSDYPNHPPKIAIRSEPLRIRLMAEQRLTMDHLIPLTFPDGVDAQSIFEIQSVIASLIKWMQEGSRCNPDRCQWYETDARLLQQEIETLKHHFGNAFRHEINPLNQNMLFSLRIKIVDTHLWLGIEFPVDFPDEMPSFFLKGRYVKARLADLFDEGQINIGEEMVEAWQDNQNIYEIICGVIQMLEEMQIEARFSNT